MFGVGSSVVMKETMLKRLEQMPVIVRRLESCLRGVELMGFVVLMVEE